MKKEEFIDELKEALEIEDENKEITLETDLRYVEEYDSLSVLAIIAMIDKNFGKQIPSSDFAKVTTISSLIDLIGIEHFE
ncbi:acyl carrier protein [Candidatus Atribacteria bacterium HGW-Atribacteria-1]|nr:MAG: acyl carrier protein [Candidatus Atribacteria bacterium HGW-Atribacteria-1]